MFSPPAGEGHRWLALVDENDFARDGFPAVLGAVAEVRGVAEGGGRVAGEAFASGPVGRAAVVGADLVGV